MVTMSSADNALKTLYLGVVTEQINTNANPLLAKIRQSTSDVWGKEIKRLAQYGVNGGVGAGTTFNFSWFSSWWINHNDFRIIWNKSCIRFKR